MSSEFPIDTLPAPLRVAIQHMVAAHWLSPGAAATAILSVTGAAVGARVRMRYGGRTRGLCVPVAAVTVPCTATTEGLDALVRPFIDEGKRLAALRPGYLQLDKYDPRKELEKVLRSDPGNSKVIAQLRYHVRELEATERPTLATMEVPGAVDAVFDGHQLMYGRAGRCLADYLHGDHRMRSEMSSVFRHAFHGYQTAGAPTLEVTPLIQTTAAIARDVVVAWAAGRPMWPLLWVDGGGAAQTKATSDAAAFANFTGMITEQLRARVSGPPRTLEVSAAGETAMASLHAELQKLGGQIRIPGCYDFIIDLLPRIAAILHQGWVDNGGDAEIGDCTWSQALAVTNWLLHHQHQLVAACPPPKASETIQMVRRYATPTAGDEMYLLKNLSRIQPAKWRKLSQRLPRRRPGYWGPVRDSLVQNEHVAWKGDLLVVTRPL